jgi:hypothetical protein
MTDYTIYSFNYFLKELEKNLLVVERLLEKELIHIKNMHSLHQGMKKVYESWNTYLNNLELNKGEEDNGK